MAGKANVIKVKQFHSSGRKVCLQPVLEQQRGRCNVAWQAIPHLCSNNSISLHRASTTLGNTGSLLELG